jgi:hypothetical protein
VSARVRIAVIALVATVAAALVCAGVWYFYIVPRANQKSDFKADVTAMGLKITKDPSWDDETTKTGKTSSTKSTLELVVKIGACEVELERDENEKAATQIDGRDVNHYTIDEIVGKQDNVAENPEGALTEADIERFLQDNYKQYNCA